MISVFISCGNKNEEIKELNKINQNHVVLIFEKNDEKLKSLYLSKGKVSYCPFDDYEARYFTPHLTGDTITIKMDKPALYLTHLYKEAETANYLFKKGDTVVFTYKEGVPSVKVKNRVSLKYDTDFSVSFESKKPLGYVEFFVINKKWRTEEEKEKYKKEEALYFSNTVKSLDSLLVKGEISKEVYAAHKANNKYYKINTEKLVFDFEGLIKQEVQYDEFLFLGSYRYFLENYVYYKYGISLLDDIDPFSYDMKAAFDSVYSSQDFSPKCKEFLLTEFFTEMAKTGISTKNDFEKLQETVKNKELIKSLKRDYLLDLEEVRKKSDSVYLMSHDKKIISLNQLLKENEGHVIYIDFWASWCAPCIKNLPESLELKKEYEKQGVKFLYLSIDKNLEEWQKSIRDEKLPYTDCFLAVNYPSSNFYKKMKLNSIPRYMLVNKKGEFINTDAPRYRKDLAKEIEKYLEE
ncbi:Thioredoxin family protein [Flavobacterium beibuense]|uniref:Thioredoxin family protein n=1 Tax=Flavobacterium beibuense TaxID=657326 RepID=A0A444WAS8_9FLAO|nr:Thioredoxin family protein [Flavobacterium beibuense]